MVDKKLLVLVIVISGILAVFGLEHDCPNPHEHYACGSACQTECATLNKPCPIVNIKCNEGCYCDKGYARNRNKECIPIDQCGCDK